MRIALPLFLAFSATALSADIAPDEAWQGVRSVFDGAGYNVRAETHLEGSALVVSPLVLTTRSGDATGRALAIDLSGMRFTPFGSGGVRMSFPKAIPIEARIKDAGILTELELNYRHAGMVIDVTGSADDAAYAFNAESVTVVLEEMRVKGVPVPKEDAEVDLRFSGISGTAHTALKAGIRFDKDVKIAKADYIVTLNETDGDEARSLNGAISDIALSLRAVLPDGATDLDLDAALAAGVEMGIALEMGSARMALAFRDHKGSGKLSATSARGVFSAEARAERIAYDVLSHDLEMTVHAPEMPGPLTFGYRELAQSAAMPGRSAAKPQPIDVKVALRDLIIGDTLWALFDPGAVMPRDPITAVLDLGAMALFPEMIFSDAAKEPDVRAMTLRALEVKGAGMAISGTGDFTFDPANAPVVKDLPAPDGVLDLRAAGVNGFLDKLLELRLIEQEEALPLRMMLGMLGRAVEGAEDTVVSHLEFEKGELVSANGQRLK